jgi:hypothetical protein
MLLRDFLLMMEADCECSEPTQKSFQEVSPSEREAMMKAAWENERVKRDRTPKMPPVQTSAGGAN